MFYYTKVNVEHMFIPYMGRYTKDILMFYYTEFNVERIPYMGRHKRHINIMTKYRRETQEHKQR